MAIPIASFTYLVNILDVIFTDTSTNIPTSWLWDFGDGSPTSNVQNPVHTYALAGVYTVSLTATNTDGSSAASTTQITIGAPVANFQFSPNGLTVQFQDTSINSPTSWGWDFGDGNTDNTQNPLHTYAVLGTYTITLTVANATGNSSISRTINVSTQPILPLSLIDFVKCKLPEGLADEDQECIDQYIAMWQLFIQPLVVPEVSIADVFNELAYPPLANALIASLTAYSIVSDHMQQTVSSSASGPGHGTGGSTTTSSSTGQLKSLETGPSKAEWYNNTDILKNVFSGSGSSGTSTVSTFFQSFLNDICSLANRLAISLPMCPALPKPIIPVTILKRTYNCLPKSLNADGTLNWDAFPAALPYY